MENNYDYTEYKEEKNRVPWARILISFLILVVIVVIILLLLKSCGKPSLRNDLIEAAKEYYEIYPEELPGEVGECFIVTLRQLEQAGLIKVSDYETCDKDATYVNVCFLESKTYHYSAILSCEDEKTNYGIWQDGTESDINENSDIRFEFLGEEKSTGTKFYYPNDLTDISKVKEYYAAIPSTGYSGKDDEQIGYKWYTEKSVNNYWNNGEYSSTQPSGYPNKGASTTVTKYSDKKPSEASYRKIEEITLYRYQELGKKMYWCHAEGDENKVLATYEPCSGEYPIKFLEVYVCVGDNDEGKPEQRVCKDFTDWSSKKCTSSDTINCESKKSYEYTDTMWKWYRKDNVRSYYPSGTTSAKEEKTYYITSPTSGAIKDETTKATVHKYYKLEEGTNDENSFEEWLTVTDGYVDMEEMIETFKELGYNVNNLSDINKLDKIRYQFQMQYRNLEE